MRSFVPARRLLLPLCLLVPLCSLQASPGRDELLRYVPEDVGFAVIVNRLRENVTALANSPFAEQLRRSPLGVSIASSADLQKLLKVERDLQQAFGLNWARLRDDVLGEALVFVYRPGPPGKPEQERGLFLLRAGNARGLADLIERVNKIQLGSGEIKGLEEREYQGLKYFRRLERNDSSSYYHLRGPVLLLTSHEETLQQALERERTVGEKEPALIGRLRQLGADAALLTLWLNPRAFDPQLEAKIARSEVRDADMLKVFRVYWEALDGVALMLKLERELSLALAVQARTAELPAPARRFLAEAAKPSELWRVFPEQALLAIGCRLDLAALVEMVGEFQAPAVRKAVQNDLNLKLGSLLGGKDFLREILPCIGPDWGLCVAAPPAQGNDWFPHVLFGLRVSPGEELSPVDQALVSAIHFSAVMAVSTHNHSHPDQPLILKRLMQDKREVNYLFSERGLQPGLQPAFALAQGYLLLASSPEALRRLGNVASPAPLAAGPVPLVRMSLKELRTYLLQRKEPIAQDMADKNHISPTEAAERLDKVLAVLQFVDRLELRQQPAKDQVVLTLAVQAAQPLKK